MSSLSGYQGMRGPTGASQGQRLAGNKVASLQQFTPEQMQLFQRMFSQVSPESFTSKLAGGDEETFNQIEAPALRQFSGLQGNIASRFSGMGTMGSRRSSGFQNTINSEASNFAQDLQSRRQQLMRQAIQDLHGMSTDLLGQRPNEQYLVEPNEKKSFGSRFAQGALPVAGTAFGFTPWGAATGGPAVWGSIGSAAGKAFS